MTLVERLEKLRVHLNRKLQSQLEDGRYDGNSAETRDVITEAKKRIEELEAKQNA